MDEELRNIVDYNHLFKLAEERFYNKIKDPEEMFESWAQYSTKIDHLGGALLIHMDRGFLGLTEHSYWVLLESGENHTVDKDCYEHLNDMLIGCYSESPFRKEERNAS